MRMASSVLICYCLISQQPTTQAPKANFESVLAWIEMVDGTMVRHADGGVSIKLQYANLADKDLARLSLSATGA
jgi:hypothetical protein